MSQFKWCNRCQRSKPVESFPARNGTRCKTQPWCRRCCSKYAASKRKAAREAKYGPTPPKGFRRCIHCKKIKRKTQFNKRTDKPHLRRTLCVACQRAHHRNWSRNKDYGMTAKQYATLLAEQNGVCAICRNPEFRILLDGSPRPLVVDHDHKTGKVRGLLCNLCNSALGYFQDSTPILKAAYHYLKSHQE